MSFSHPPQALIPDVPERGDDPRRADRIEVPGTAAVIDEAPRPHRNLLIYHALQSLLLGPFFWALLIPQYFRYHTLRYRFDDEGVTMRWGVLFRREISLTYARIQDIHLTSNIVERWLGLAKIQIQTASGSAGAEMTIEGLREFQQIRDFLYSRMRGTREQSRHPARAPSVAPDAAAPASLSPTDVAELTATLRAVTDELRALRAALPAREPADREVPRG
jgi:membrane protein YdbS with pleckstrin-like domain